MRKMETQKTENLREKIQIIKPDRAMMIPQKVENNKKEEERLVRQQETKTTQRHSKLLSTMTGMTERRF